MSFNIRKPEFSFKSLFLLMLACVTTGLIVGGLGIYYGAKNTYHSNAAEKTYLKTIVGDSIHAKQMDEAIAVESRATRFHQARADQAESKLRNRETSFDSLLRVSRIKSRPVVSKQDYINADKWVQDYNKNLKR